VTRLSAHGFTVDAPAGWDARIYRRPAAGEVAATAADGPPAPPGASTYAVVHVATIPMPPDIGDFGSSAVDQLGPDDAFVVVFDHGPEAVGKPLFERHGMPRVLDAGDFAPNVLQRTLPGQAGLQAFFTESGRACCLYVVLGSYANRGRVVPRVNEVLADLEIETHRDRDTALHVVTSDHGADPADDRAHRPRHRSDAVAIRAARRAGRPHRPARRHRSVDRLCSLG
jgi:hypothetical protein